MLSTLLFDLDGTLAIMRDRSPYDASTCENDMVNLPVLECIRAMWLKGCKIIFVSGRDSKYRDPTVRFIERHCRYIVDGQCECSEAIPYELFMRPTGDCRKDSVVKLEIFDKYLRGKYNVLFCLDDRNQVVKEAWRAIGLTCFQVAEGDF